MLCGFYDRTQDRNALCFKWQRSRGFDVVLEALTDASISSGLFESWGEGASFRLFEKISTRGGTMVSRQIELYNSGRREPWYAGRWHDKRSRYETKPLQKYMKLLFPSYTAGI